MDEQSSLLPQPWQLIAQMHKSPQGLKKIAWACSMVKLTSCEGLGGLVAMNHVGLQDFMTAKVFHHFSNHILVHMSLIIEFVSQNSCKLAIKACLGCKGLLMYQDNSGSSHLQLILSSQSSLHAPSQCWCAMTDSSPWTLLDSAELEWLDQQTPLRLEWSSELHAAACKAATEGKIAVLRTILARSGFHCRSQASNRHHCQDATCSASSSCALLYLTLSFCTQKLKVYRAAVISGQVPVLAWLFHEVHPCPWEALDAHCGLVSRLLCAAAASGQLPVLLWLHEELPSQL